MQRTKVILLGVIAACGYGLIHDQVTVRLCPEYFTVAHPPIFPTASLTLLALFWGVAATSGVGAIFGVVLAKVSQPAELPPISALRLGRAVLLLLGVMALSAGAAGFIGYELGERGYVTVPAAFAAMVPLDHRHRFIAAWFAHSASYAIGLAGGTRLCYRIWRENGRPAAISVFPRTPMAMIRTLIVAGVAAFVVWLRFRGDGAM